MNRLFVDTNIVLDLLGRRKEYPAAAELFSRADRGELEICVSALTFANANYILGRQLDRLAAVRVLRDLSLVVRVVDLSGRVVRLALNDNAFTDFEDSLQYYSALESDSEVIITRNQRDFTTSKLPVLSAGEYLNSQDKG
ncbi:PIN domain-containing protein [Neolewinella xylanilytica]|uniref:PIN domain-containing protein n=1 Tax=Neolewinella xylanilytica TaxID=1514080 RepID=A0A2S6I5V0_9BACT|nr:PIN domain-containing protein [Neolewinella xylanilytica]PPK86544.1 PIN domain-containing protein [Neolewinella xylanilytica]